MGLQPVPVADDGGSLHRVATLRPLPSEGAKTNKFRGEKDSVSVK